MIFSAKDFNVYHLGSIPVSYPPKGINTHAILVTAENIGALSLEFRVGLIYDKDGTPYFKIRAERGNDEEPESPATLSIYADDWLIVLWDELHVFQDVEFRNTFRMDMKPPLDVQERYFGPTLGATIGTPEVAHDEVRPPEDR